MYNPKKNTIVKKNRFQWVKPFWFALTQKSKDFICIIGKGFFWISGGVLVSVLAHRLLPILSASPLYPLFLVGGISIYILFVLKIMSLVGNARIDRKNCKTSLEIEAFEQKRQKKMQLSFLYLYSGMLAFFAVVPSPFFSLSFIMFVIGTELTTRYFVPRARSGHLPRWFYRWLGRHKPDALHVLAQVPESDPTHEVPALDAGMQSNSHTI